MTDENAVVPPVEEKIIPKVENNEGGEAAPEKEAAEEDIENLDIPVRSSASHIIARQKRTIEKLRSKESEESDHKAPAQEDDSGNDDDDDDLTPQARKALSKEINRHVRPLIDSLANKADEDELSSLLSNEPEAKAYEKRIKAYMAHPAWKAVPPSAIYHHLAFEKAASVGMKAKDIANREVLQMRGAGASRRPTDINLTGIPTAEEQESMSESEFEKLQQDVRAGKYLQK